MCFGAEKRFNLGQVVDQLKPVTGWSRNTVHTYLTRMESKGLVTIDRSKDPHQYKAGVSHEECARKERRNLLEKIYGGATGDLVTAFLKESKITEEEQGCTEKSCSMRWRSEMTNIWEFCCRQRR